MDDEKVPSRSPSIDQILSWYERQPWLRAIVQMVPVGGGSIDTLLAWRGTHLNQQRIEELFNNVSDRLRNVEERSLHQESIKSEDFFEVFRTCAETAAHTASEYKRARLADFLAGVIVEGLDDLTAQFAEDLKNLQELDLLLLTVLPTREGLAVYKNRPNKYEYEAFDSCTYKKALSNLQRLGLVEPSPSEDHWGEKEGGVLFTTEYLSRFMYAMTAGIPRNNKK
jgi:hypothetical protein